MSRLALSTTGAATTSDYALSSLDTEEADGDLLAPGTAPVQVASFGSGHRPEGSSYDR